MNPEYIRKIEELLGEMRKKQMDPVGKADADIDNDGDVDSSDKYLHKRRAAIKKKMKHSKESTENFSQPITEKMGDYDWVHIARAGSFYNPKKDKIIGYSKSPKDPNRSPKIKSGANSVIRIGDAKKKGFTMKEAIEVDDTSKDAKVTPCPSCEGSMENHDPECPKAKSEACGDYHKKTKKEEVELDENFRTLATKGMGAETKKTVNVGRDVDYYEPKNGDKRQGKITKVHATGYHVKDENDGKTHKFAFHDRTKAKKMLESKQPVVSEQWGFGEVIETTDEGLNVYFEHGVEFNVLASSLTFIEDKQHTKGATEPEGLLDKESPRSKKFVKDHQKSNKEYSDLEMKGHVDATKAGRATTKQAPARPGEKRVGDIKIVNPVQGAVTQTTGKE